LSSQPASLLSPFVPVPVRCLVTDCFDPASLLPQYTVVRTPRQKKSKRRRGTRNTTELTEDDVDDVDDVGEGGRQHQHKRGPAGHKQYVAGAVNPSHVLYTNMARYEQVVVGAGFTGSHVVDVLMCLMASLTESYTDAVVHMKNVFVQSLFFFFLLLLFSFVSPVAPVAPVSSRHVLGILRVTLKDVTGLLYLNSPKSFPQLQHLFPKTIRKNLCHLSLVTCVTCHLCHLCRLCSLCRFCR